MVKFVLLLVDGCSGCKEAIELYKNDIETGDVKVKHLKEGTEEYEKLIKSGITIFPLLICIDKGEKKAIKSVCIVNVDSGQIEQCVEIGDTNGNGNRKKSKKARNRTKKTS